MSTCGSCQAEVVFVASATSGKPMILDATPRKGVVITDSTMNLHGMVGLAGKAEGRLTDEARVVDVYTDHHGTCPEGPAWKGRSRQDPPPRREGWEGT